MAYQFMQAKIQALHIDCQCYYGSEQEKQHLHSWRLDHSEWVWTKLTVSKQKNKDNSKEKSAIKYKRKPIISQCWGGLGLICTGDEKDLFIWVTGEFWLV